MAIVNGLRDFHEVRSLRLHVLLAWGLDYSLDVIVVVKQFRRSESQFFVLRVTCLWINVGSANFELIHRWFAWRLLLFRSRVLVADGHLLRISEAADPQLFRECHLRGISVWHLDLNLVDLLRSLPDPKAVLVLHAALLDLHSLKDRHLLV